MTSWHLPVLLVEVIENLRLSPNDNVIDGTLGGGGHTEKILEQIAPYGKVIGMDVDRGALNFTKERLSKYCDRLALVNENFRNLPAVAKRFDLPIKAVLLDLGVSTYQLKNVLGFDAEKLDMRLAEEAGDLTAEKIVNKFSEQELINIFKNLGDERLALPIAREVIKTRKIAPITTPQMLVEVVKKVYRRFYHKPSETNPATKVFQALRIKVNHELESLEAVLPDIVKILAPGGRVAIITFHSLEDRIVKNFFRDESRDCLCPPSAPKCICGHKKSLKIITKKGVRAGDKELAVNPSARSASLRVAEKI